MPLDSHETSQTGTHSVSVRPDTFLDPLVVQQTADSLGEIPLSFKPRIALYFWSSSSDYHWSFENFQSPRFFPTVAGFRRPERKPGPKNVARKLGYATAQVVKSSYEQLKDARVRKAGDWVTQLSSHKKPQQKCWTSSICTVASVEWCPWRAAIGFWSGIRAAKNFGSAPSAGKSFKYPTLHCSSWSRHSRRLRWSSSALKVVCQLSWRTRSECCRWHTLRRDPMPLRRQRSWMPLLISLRLHQKKWTSTSPWSTSRPSMRPSTTLATGDAGLWRWENFRFVALGRFSAHARLELLKHCHPLVSQPSRRSSTLAASTMDLEILELKNLGPNQRRYLHTMKIESSNLLEKIRNQNSETRWVQGFWLPVGITPGRPGPLVSSSKEERDEASKLCLRLGDLPPSTTWRDLLRHPAFPKSIAKSQAKDEEGTPPGKQKTPNSSLDPWIFWGIFRLSVDPASGLRAQSEVCSPARHGTRG